MGRNILGQTWCIVTYIPRPSHILNLPPPPHPPTLLINQNSGTNNCNNCILGQCTACNQGYELFLNNNTCSEIFFSLKISVNTDNQIVLDFSEDLSNPLSSSDLTTFYESKEVSHTLNYVNPKKYMVNITDLNTTIDSNQIFIQFNKELTSATSSFLNTLNYTCNLLPSPTQYFNKFTATCQIIYQTLMMAAILLGITSMFSGTQSSLV